MLHPSGIPPMKNRYRQCPWMNISMGGEATSMRLALFPCHLNRKKKRGKKVQFSCAII